MKYSSDSVYPEVKVENKNIEYARLLLNNYAGIISETTTVMTYAYQSVTQNEDIHEIFNNINIVEMKHMEILGELIKLLGINPEYKSNLRSWTSNFINYSTDIEDVLNNNIKNELQAIKNYSDNINLINDIYIKRILKRIIEDEKIHVEIFQNLLNNMA